MTDITEDERLGLDWALDQIQHAIQTIGILNLDKVLILTQKFTEDEDPAMRQDAENTLRIVQAVDRFAHELDLIEAELPDPEK